MKQTNICRLSGDITIPLSSAEFVSLSAFSSTFKAVLEYQLDPKPAPLAVFAAESSSAENPPKKSWLAEYAIYSSISAESLHRVCFVHDNYKFTVA